MAKSYDKKDMSFVISDDMIKEALKTGLTSIEASDDLVTRTLAKCRNEISQVQDNRNKNFIMPLIYKVGAPLAAGALILVLMLNTNNPLLSSRKSTAMPQASSMENAGAAEDSGIYDKSMKGEEGNAVSASALPEVAFTDSLAAPSEAPAPQPSVAQGFSGDTGYALTYGSRQLNSSSNRTKNSSDRGQTPSMDLFNEAVSQYNTMNSTQFTLDEANVTRIQTLVQGGVNADMLKNAKSYQELLSGEGYWALPLKDPSGKVERLLTVNDLADNPNMTISSSDLLIIVEEEKFIASTYPDAALLESKFSGMLDSDALIKLIQTKGYKEVTELLVTDINYGMDFMVFAKADGEELAIPYLKDETVFGLANGDVYKRDELFKVISQVLQ